MYSDNQFYLDVERPQRLSRLLIFIKWLLILPHTFILSIYSWAVSIAAFLAWFVILFTGAHPPALWDFIWGYVRWTTRVSVYTYLLRDEYPPFGDGPYPLELSLRRPERSSRLLLFGRIFMLIPLALWLMVLTVVQAFALIYAWVMILISGQIPANAFDMIVKILRYSTRVSCYSLLLTDTWPGFSLENPGATY